MDTIKITGSEKKTDSSNDSGSTVKNEPRNLKDTIKIPLKDDVDKKEEYVEIEFDDNDLNLKGNIGDKTKEVKDPFEGKTVEQVQAEIKNEEVAAGQKLDYDDIKLAAEFIIEIFDTFMSTSLRWWSGDDTDEPYSLPKGKKDRLVKMLTLILVKYSAKFRIEVYFIILLVLSYANPVRNAMKVRKQRNKKPIAEPVQRKQVKVSKIKEEDNTGKSEETSAETKKEENATLSNTVVKKKNPNPPFVRKRGPGRVRKG